MLLEELYKEEYKAAHAAADAAKAQGFAIDDEKAEIDIRKHSKKLPKDLQKIRAQRLNQLRKSMFIRKKGQKESSSSSSSTSSSDSEENFARKTTLTRV